MAPKQSDYLNELLSDDSQPIDIKDEKIAAAPADRPSVKRQSLAAQRLSGEAGDVETRASRRERGHGTTLLGRESALARVASGDVKQVTQLLLDPNKVRIWPGNARVYDDLNLESCQELVDSIIAEGGQKVPAVVRRIEGDPAHEYEVIAGTRRHWAVSWLRANNYADIQFLAQVQQLDDESAFRLADLENRARTDVSDIERARNYAAALDTHYGGHQTRMAERLRLSKGWLSKMLKVARLPDDVIAAFASRAEIKLKPAYPLAQAVGDPKQANAIKAEARRLRSEQARRREDGQAGLSAAEVIKRLLDAPKTPVKRAEPYVGKSAQGRTAVSVLSANRQGVTLRLHAGAGACDEEIFELISEALSQLEQTGRGLKR